MQVSWEAGHSPRAHISSIARSDTRTEIQNCDLFVRLCTTVDVSVQTECFWANDAHKPLLLLLVNIDREPDASRQLLENAADGSSARKVTADPLVFAKDYLLSLHDAVRVLDARSSGLWVTQGSDLHIRNPFWRRFASRVNQWATLDGRFRANAPLKQAAAEFFLDHYLGIILKARISRLFFESGSAIAFLSESFAARVDQKAFMAWGGHIETNNVISYMEFVLGQFASISLYPGGPPERKYGGTFGELKDLAVPSEGAHPIHATHHELMSNVRNHFSEQYTDLGIIFGGASGIDLSRGTELLGPHVGSYDNMLFKRALLESGAPLVLIVDEDKMPRRFSQGQCFLVCDEEFSWHYACRNVPLAIVCAFRSEERARTVISDLEYLGLNHLELGRRGEAPWCMIASNDLFSSRRQEWLTAALEDVTAKDPR